MNRIDDTFLTFPEFVKHMKKLEGVDIIDYIPEEFMADIHVMQLFPRYKEPYSVRNPNKTIEDMIRDRVIPVVVAFVYLPKTHYAMFSELTGTA